MPTGRGKPSWEAASRRNRWAAADLGYRHTALTRGRRAARVSGAAALRILSPHQAGGHNEHLPPFPPHQQQQHLTEPEKPRTSPPCGLQYPVLGGKGAQGKGKSQFTSRKLLLLLHASHTIHLLFSRYHPFHLDLWVCPCVGCTVRFLVCWVRGTKTRQITTIQSCSEKHKKEVKATSTCPDITRHCRYSTCKYHNDWH